MHWKTKALIQRTVAMLPDHASYATYYWLQRTFGGLGTFDPSHGLFVGAETWKRIQKTGRNPAGKVFLEVGTGRVPIVPIALYLMGAARTITVDLNPYLQPELLADALRRMVGAPDKVRSLLGPRLDEARWSALQEYQRRTGGTDSSGVMSLCGIEYIAPIDAAATGLPAGSIDYHTSNTTLEHIPPAILASILVEGDRLIATDGLLIHRIDYSDHFSHSDKGISPINFLRFSDARWNFYAGNRYMYMNRLRHDDMVSLFGRCGHNIIANEPDINNELLEAARAHRLTLHDSFAKKPAEVLATTGAWIVSEKARA